MEQQYNKNIEFYNSAHPFIDKRKLAHAMELH
jgi:hypothetical protein